MRLSEDEWTDRALEELAHATPSNEYYARCPGCDLLVHHTDETTHARTCAPLRALVTP